MAFALDLGSRLRNRAESAAAASRRFVLARSGIENIDEFGIDSEDPDSSGHAPSDTVARPHTENADADKLCAGAGEKAEPVDAHMVRQSSEALMAMPTLCRPRKSKAIKKPWQIQRVIRYEEEHEAKYLRAGRGRKKPSAERPVFIAPDDVLGAMQVKTSKDMATAEFLEQRQEERALVRALKKWPTWRVACLAVSQSRIFLLVRTLMIWANVFCVVVSAWLPPDQARALRGATNFFEIWFFHEFLITASGHFVGLWWMDGLLCVDCFVAIVCFIGICLKFGSRIATAQMDGFISGITMLRVWRTYRCFMPPKRTEGLILGIDVLRFLQRFTKWRPVNIIIASMAGTKIVVLSSLVYLGTVFLCVAILLRGLAGILDASAAPELEDALDGDMFTVPRISLVLFELSQGRLQWRTMILPYFKSEELGWQVYGGLLMAAVGFSKFCLWTLSFAVFLKEAVAVARKFDAEAARQALYAKVGYDLRGILENVDRDQDGLISLEDLQRQASIDAKIYDVFGGTLDSIQLLHSALDYEGTGLVPIDDIVCGVARMQSSSKSFDWLAIDYRQRSLVRSIVEVEHSTREEADRVYAILDETVAECEELRGGCSHLQGRFDTAKELLQQEIGKMDKILARHQQHLEEHGPIYAEAQDVQLAEELRETRRALEGKVDRLGEQVHEVAVATKLQAIHAAGPDAVMALRAAVRRRLQTQLEPWLQQTLDKQDEAPLDKKDEAPQH